MTTLNFDISINATKEKVWKTLWDDSTYRKWTAVFFEGSYAKSDWNEGSKILFLSPKGDGMFAEIVTKIENKQMTFKFLGEVHNGIEESKDWQGASESYHLEEANHVTHLHVKHDSNGEMEEYYKKTFPKSLETLKKISEE